MTAAWILVVVLDMGNPFHDNITVTFDYSTRSQCMEARSYRVKLGGIISANCYKKESK